MKKLLPWVIAGATAVFVIVWGTAGILIFENDYEQAQPFLHAGGAACAVLCAALLGKVLTNKCPHCGKIRRTRGKFCPYCGKEI